MKGQKSFSSLKDSCFDGEFINSLFAKRFDIDFNGKRNLYIVLGLLGDFDSIEYTQCLVPYLDKLSKSNIQLSVVGIGNNDSKEYFCNYTKLPESYLKLTEDLDIHNQLKLSKGLCLPINPVLNLMLMCMGINSPGTLKEVLRGYVGDNTASNIFDKEEKIYFTNNIAFKASMFNTFGHENALRPFELASLRLKNMIEVLANWNIYMPNHNYLTQRGGTFFIDENNHLLFSYYNKALLGFSKTMSKPLDYLDNLIKDLNSL